MATAQCAEALEIAEVTVNFKIKSQTKEVLEKEPMKAR
jgi:hypothetical protein